jgi:hypothetical protein
MRRKSLLRQKKFSMWLNEVELNKLKLEAVRQGADRKSNRMRAIMTHVLGITGLRRVPEAGDQDLLRIIP